MKAVRSPFSCMDSKYRNYDCEETEFFNLTNADDCPIWSVRFQDSRSRREVFKILERPFNVLYTLENINITYKDPGKKYYLISCPHFGKNIM